MVSELDLMYTNQVWTLVDKLEGIKPIGCKWVYKRKIAPNGKVETYKRSEEHTSELQSP